MSYFKEMSKDGYIVAISPEEAMYLDTTGKFNKTTTGNITIYFIR